MRNDSNGRTDIPTILVVDEDETARATTARVLSHSGFNVKSSDDLDLSSGALSAEISLVILDLGKSLKAGYNALRRIHRAAPNIPVLVSTGFSAEYAESSGDISVACGILEKPYTVQAVLEKIRVGINSLKNARELCAA